MVFSTIQTSEKGCMRETKQTGRAMRASLCGTLRQKSRWRKGSEDEEKVFRQIRDLMCAVRKMSARSCQRCVSKDG